MAKKLFGGKETPAEEMKEASALKSGRISKPQYVAGEKSEGHGAGAGKTATAIKSGRLSPQAYAAQEKTEGMKKGGCVKMTRGGGVASKGVGRGTVVKMAKGGGVETKGKTRGKMC